MYLVRVASLLAVGIVVCGCGQPLTIINDDQFYDSGGLKTSLESYREGKFSLSHASEYFEDGRLKSEEWRVYELVAKLAFYENGRLKSEERFSNGQMTYGVYYSEVGEIERTVGKRSVSAPPKKSND